MTSLRDWLADQIAEAVRPIAHRITADLTSTQADWLYLLGAIR